MKKVGAHVHTEGGVQNAPLNAREIGADDGYGYMGRPWFRSMGILRSDSAFPQYGINPCQR